MPVRISDDASARATGADDVAAAFAAAGADVARVSSWGMQWLEPLVEVDGIGHANVTPADVADILAGSTRLAIGPVAEHPFIARQQRLTFAPSRWPISRPPAAGAASPRRGGSAPGRRSRR